MFHDLPDDVTSAESLWTFQAPTHMFPVLTVVYLFIGVVLCQLFNCDTLSGPCDGSGYVDNNHKLFLD